MSVGKNQSKCQNTAFLLVNIQIWICFLCTDLTRKRDSFDLKVVLNTEAMFALWLVKIAKKIWDIFFVTAWLKNYTTANLNFLLVSLFVYLLDNTVEHGRKIKKFILLLQHFGEQTQANRLVFMEKYASKHV